jgi:hypothetical protein
MLKEKHRLRVFDSRLWRRIFGRKRDEVTEGLRKIHKMLENFYSLPNILAW